MTQAESKAQCTTLVTFSLLPSKESSVKDEAAIMQNNSNMKSQHYNCMSKYMPDKLFNLGIPLRTVPFFSKQNEQSKGYKYLQCIYIYIYLYLKFL